MYCKQFCIAEGLVFAMYRSQIFYREAVIIYFPTSFSSFYLWNTLLISCIPGACCYYFSRLIIHSNRIKKSACIHHMDLATVRHINICCCGSFSDSCCDISCVWCCDSCCLRYCGSFNVCCSGGKYFCCSDSSCVFLLFRTLEGLV